MSTPLEIETTALAKREPTELAKAEPLDIGGLMQQIIASGKANENAAAIEKLLDVHLKIEAKSAERLFNTAFVELQAEIPKVQATKIVPTKNGGIKFKYAPLEEIENQVRPICRKYGFTYSFTEGPARDGFVTKICKLRHIGGHCAENSFSVRIGAGPYGATETQADCAAHSSAKRGALCDALTIRVSQVEEQDPHNEGGPVTAQQAEELERRAKETNSNIDKFLQWAGADMSAKNRWATIPANRYDECDRQLRRKEGK